jgi:ABC-type polysaccharide/polyol phosphate export permease
MQMSALQDLRSSIYAHRGLWINLGIRDIRGRYRRTIIGPFWNVLNTAIVVGALGVVYALLWRVEIRVFLPYFCSGYIAWILFTSTISESCSAFIGAEPIIRSLPLPYLIHILRVIWRNVIVFAHNLVVYVGVIAYFQIWPGANLLWVPVGVLLVCVNVFWIGLVVALFCARFRDVIPMVTSFLQVLFFITPIFWPADRLSVVPVVSALLSDANLAYHVVEVMRAPLSGQSPSLGTLIALTACGLLGNVVAVMFFNRYRTRVAFWL